MTPLCPGMALHSEPAFNQSSGTETSSHACAACALPECVTALNMTLIPGPSPRRARGHFHVLTGAGRGAILMPSMQAPWHKQYKWWHWRRSLRTRTYFNEARVWSPPPWSGLGGRKVSLTFRSQSVSSTTARARPISVWSLEMFNKFIPTGN